MNEPIAIVGMGCKYPQAPSLDELWRLLVDGRDAIGPYPGARFRDLDQAYADAAAGRGGIARGGIATHCGGFLPEVDRFDAAFFGISPREANFIDPQQRLLLEVSWNALEDAGQLREQYQGSRTGVFTGLWTTDYENHIFRNSEQPEFYLLTGGGRSTACGRVSFAFGFEGPGISVDTACSSSMVAIHLACQSLRQRECDMALAGGVNVILSTDFTKLFTNAGMLSADARCKFGDKSANGFVRSEGAGMVVLKRLSDAVAAGDGIYAVIRGSAVNNDGRSSGLLVTPSRDGQRMMLLEAWRQAGIDATDLNYIEAHGTGTQVGDPVEIGAISDALLESGATGRISIGSMKGNIGHTESAAGVAGVIKAALVLANGAIPPSLHCTDPNPEIDWAHSPVEVISAGRLLTGSSDRPRLVGASSFGLTGTNAHMVLEEYRRPLDRATGVEDRDSLEQDSLELDQFRAAYLLPLSGYTQAALESNCRNWMDFLGTVENNRDLADICLLAGARRTALAYRCAVVGESALAMQSELAALLSGAVSDQETLVSPAAPAGAPMRVVFVAPGQGSQWDGMTRELLGESREFQESFVACDRAIAAETGWSLMERLESAEAARYLTEIDFVQPALFAMSVALAAVWQAAGVVPEAVIGHSMGEIAAAHLAGILTLEDAAAVICRRSRLMRTLSGSGAMASVELPSAELAQWLEPFEGKISVAAENSPGSTVVAGEAEAVDQLLEWLELKEIFSRRIRVDVASHSPMVDPILDALRQKLAGLKPGPSSVRFFSTVKGAFLDGGEADGEYWVENLRQPVRLATAVSSLRADGYNCFIELSPHPVLTPALEATVARADSGATAAASGPGLSSDVAMVAAVVLPSLLRAKPAWSCLLQSMGRFWDAGGRLNWKYLSGRGVDAVSHRLRLPDYAFERERFWPEELNDAQFVSRHEGRAQLSPLIENRTDPANEPGTSIFRVIGDLDRLPYLTDHRVGGAIVFPASAHLEAALEAAALLRPGMAYALENILFLQALYLSRTEEQELQLIVSTIAGKDQQFSFSLKGRQGTGAGGWTEHSTGTICCSGLVATADGDDGEPHEANCSGVGGLTGSELDRHSGIARRKGTRQEHYRKASRSGLEYGPAFQLVEDFESTTIEGAPFAQTTLLLDAELQKTFSSSGYLLHPALLDCCFQSMIHLRPRISGMPMEDVYLPLSLGRLRLGGGAFREGEIGPSQLKTRALFRGVDVVAGTMEFELQLMTLTGSLVAAVEAMTVQRVKTRSGEGLVENLFSMSWVSVAPPQAPTPGGSAGKHWLIFADSNLHADLNANDSRANGSQADDSLRPRTSASTAAILARSHAALAGRSTLVWAGSRFRALGAGERRLDQLGADEYEIPVNDTAALDTLLRLVAAEAGQIDAVIDLWTIAAHSAIGSDFDKDSHRFQIDRAIEAQTKGVKFVPVIAQAITRAGWVHPPQLWLATRGSQSVVAGDLADDPMALAGSTVWGLGAALWREMPELKPVLVDLSGEQGEEVRFREAGVLAELIAHTRRRGKDDQQPSEDRFALRGESIFAARLTPTKRSTSGGVEQPSKRPLRAGESLRIEIERPGSLDQLALRAIENTGPAANEVTIEVTFAGLNFIDAAKALGIYPGLDPKASIQMGGECSGRIVAVGHELEGEKLGGWRVGDEVIALTPSPTRTGLLISRANVPAALVLRKPDGFSLAEAAALPIAYLTAHYALNELARVRAGEWVLIHAGAGGVGLAAASIALAKGARVIATASSPEKHAFLKGWGVEHVLQSRSLAFAEGVMEITGGKGVNVVLNSLAGDFIPKSLEVLAAYGRFIELGKRDIYDDKRVGLKAFRQNISYFAVDLAALIEDRPGYAEKMFREVMEQVASGRWARLPVCSFKASEPAAAFEFMVQGRHIGKLAIDFGEANSLEGEGDSKAAIEVLPPVAGEVRALFDSKASYILTGGLGGVGSAVAEWMAGQGAGCLVLVSRREASAQEMELMQRIRALGTRVEHQRTDLLDQKATLDLVAEIARSMPPLRGIMHAAAVIDDALISNVSPSRFDSVFGPKITGTWNLHQATLDEKLDFFVMFSSFASIFPQPGHGSYSAANSFMDSFAAYRRGLGLPAMSINWAGWLGMGLARESGTSRTIEAYESEGFGSFDREEALFLLGEALRADPIQAAAVRVDMDQVAASFDEVPSLFRDLMESGQGSGKKGAGPEGAGGAEHSLVEELSASGEAERLMRLEQLLRSETSRVLKLAPEKISSTQPFGQMGIDSLMALELIRRVNGALGLSLPATAVFNYPTLTVLAAQILKRLGLDSLPVIEKTHAGPGNKLVDDGTVGGVDGSLKPSKFKELSEEDALRELMEPGELPREL